MEDNKQNDTVSESKAQTHKEEEVQFPQTLEQKSHHRTKKERDIVFQNYTPIDKSFKREPANQILHVKKLEQMYSKKVTKQIKGHLQNENDPVQALVPKKSNIDLKRNFNAKLEGLSRKTERAIIEILKEQLNEEEKSL